MTSEHMGRAYGSQSMVDPLRRVLVRRPDEAFGNADPKKWHYAGRPNLGLAQREHDDFVEILWQAGAEVVFHDEPLPDLADALYVHDPVLVTERGAIVLRMGKDLRRGEEDAMARRLEAVGIPVYRRLTGTASAEGGDLMWVDHDTLAVGLGFRTNREGLRQLEEILVTLGVTTIPVELPYHKGPEACLHLMSLISIVAHDLAVIYPRLLPEAFRRYLGERGFRFIEVPDEEFETMGTNVLALAPRRCLMLQGNPVTKRRLESTGCEVLTYVGTEISLKAEGGPTCLTRPLLRR